MRPPAKTFQILLPVWGARYVEQCLRICLPSLLADGNIPALSRRLPCELVLLVRAADRGTIEADPVIAQIAKVCTVRFVAIDDLISGASAMVLTLAYARAIRAAGPAMTDTCFFFLVSDYLLADGSLAGVADRILAGADGVLAGNFQVAAETMEPLLPRHGDALSVAPRDLVALSLGHLHPSSLANMAGPRLSHDPESNRLFWPAGAGCMIGRFYLLHMIAIRPERTTFQLTAPCDYALIPELCPSGHVVTMTDSDDYFAVEMQMSGERVPPLALGPLDPAALAQSLARWTTEQHRRNATQSIVFHSGDLPPDVADADDEAGLFVSAVAAELSTPPTSVRDDPSWARTMQHHLATSIAAPDLAELSRLVGIDVAQAPPPRGLSRFRAALVGRAPDARPWHPRWADGQRVYSSFRRIPQAAQLLLVSDAPAAMLAAMTAAAIKAGAASVTAVGTGELSNRPADAAGCDFCMLVLGAAARQDDGRHLAALVPWLTADAGVLVIVGDVFSDDVGVVGDARVQQIDAWLNADPAGLVLTSVDGVPCGPWRLGIQATMMDLVRGAARRGGLGGMAWLLGGVGLASLSLATNIAASRFSGARERRGWSTLILSLHQRVRVDPVLTGRLSGGHGPSPHANAGAGFARQRNPNGSGLQGRPQVAVARPAADGLFDVQLATPCPKDGVTR